jgi:hypothetical protein
VPRGLHDATTAGAAVDAWWRARPHANVGIRTGAESGLVVLDVDGAAGAEALRDLVAQHGRFDAWWARTGSGGWHAYLAHPDETVPNSTKRVGPGLDVRGDGGYVVAPPSVHASLNPYRWSTGPGTVPPMPGWLVEAARSPAAEHAPSQPIRVHDERVSAYVAAAVEGEAGEVATTPAGQRNNRLNLAAYRLGRLVAGGHVAEGTATAALQSAAQQAGLSEHEALTTIRSGLRAGMRSPRDIDVDRAPSAATRPPTEARRREQEAEAC